MNREVELFMEDLITLPLVQQLKKLYKISLGDLTLKNSIIKSERWLEWCVVNRKYAMDHEINIMLKENSTDDEIEAYLILQKIIE